MPPAPTPIAPIIAGRAALAAVLGVSVRTVATLEQAGIVAATARGRGGRPSTYDLSRVVPAYIRHVTAQAPATTSARDRRDHAQAALAEHLLSVRRGQYVPVADVERVWCDEIAGARSLILVSHVAAADRVARAVVTGGTAGAERELRALAHAVLRELSGQSPDPLDPADREAIDTLCRAVEATVDPAVAWSSRVEHVYRRLPDELRARLEPCRGVIAARLQAAREARGSDHAQTTD